MLNISVLVLSVWRLPIKSLLKVTFLIAPSFLEYVISFPNQTEVQVFGTHYVQEVSPHAIGRAVADWMQGI